MFREEMAAGATISDLLELCGISEEEWTRTCELDGCLDDMIHTFGFEDPRTISVAVLIERQDVTVETVKRIVEGLLQMA